MSLPADILRKNTTLSEKKIKMIVALYKPFKTRRNQEIVSRGEVARYIYFVVKGYLRVGVTNSVGHQFTRFLIEEGMVGTAFPSFVSQKPSTASIRCVGQCEVLRLSYQDLNLLCKKIPEFETYYRGLIEQAYIQAIHRIESLISMSAYERYRLLLKEKPKLFQQLPANVIAEYLGITKETLSRLKSRK